MRGEKACGLSNRRCVVSNRITDAGRRRHGFDHRLRQRNIVRHALLQEQFGRLDHRLRMEAPAHRRLTERVTKHVGDGDHAHALVVRHVAVDHRHIRVFGKPRLGVIQRLVPAVSAATSGVRQAREVGCRGHRDRSSPQAPSHTARSRCCRRRRA